MLTITALLAFAMGGSKNTASIFSGWCRMFGSMCLLMVTNLVCCKMLFSVVSTVPSGLDVLPWIVKVAKKSDAIITRIGLNPAITGGPGKTLPGMLAYTVARTAVSHVVKSMGGGKSGGGTSAKAPSRGAAKHGGSLSRFSGKGIDSGRHSPHSIPAAGQAQAAVEAARPGAAQYRPKPGAPPTMCRPPSVHPRRPAQHRRKTRSIHAKAA